MPIAFRCHACGRLLHTPDYAAGGKARCPECGAAVPVPEPNAVPAGNALPGESVDPQGGGSLEIGTPGRMTHPAALDPNAPALRETPSSHASDTDYPVRRPRKLFETTVARSETPLDEQESPGIDQAMDNANNAAAANVAPGKGEGNSPIAHPEEHLRAALQAIPFAGQSPVLLEAIDEPAEPQLSHNNPSGGSVAGSLFARESTSHEDLDQRSEAPSLSGPRPPVRVGEVIGTAWKAFVAHLFSSVGVGLTAKLIFAAGVVALVFSMIGLVEVIDHGNDEECAAGAVGIVAVFGAMFLLVGWLLAGLCLYVSNIARGHTASFLDLFRGKAYMYRMFLATVIFGMLVFAGLSLFFLPGVYVFMRLGLFPNFIVDRNQGAIAALRSSWQVTESRAGKVALAWLATGGIWLAVGMVPLGFLFSTPLALWILAVLYYRLCGEDPAQQAAVAL